jgi:phage terminase small subunit
VCRLNDKQLRFAQEYTVDLNATQAAIRAGYSTKTAYSQGQRLLKKDEIQDAIREANRKRSEATGITAEWVLTGIAEIATREDARDADRLKAFELLGKHLGIWEQRQTQEDSSIRVEIGAAEDLAE